MENQNNENQTEQQQEQERKFTQDDVNRIVGERLARVKHENSSNNADREAELNKREMTLNARESLADAGLPKELLPLVNCTSEKDIKESIKLISTYFGNKGDSGILSGEQTGSKQGTAYRMLSGGMNTGSGNGGAGTSDDEIRKAMGLKGR